MTINIENIQKKDTLTTAEACAYMGISKRTMYNLTGKNRVLPYTQPMGKMMYFKRADLDEYMSRNRHATKEEIEERAKGGAE